MIDLTQRRFCRLVVLALAPPHPRFNGCAAWCCLCDCGARVDVSGGYLRNGRTRSCGCLRREVSRKNATSHGRYLTTEHLSWREAKQRCHNPKNTQFHRYGGRGIRMCDEWRRDFLAFLAHMGPKPPGHTLDRINNDGNYEPGNVRWATPKQQANNRRRPVSRHR